MANNNPAIVTITSRDINNNNVAKTFNAVREIKYDFYENMINIVDVTGSFYFPYNPVATVTHVIAGGITNITIS